MGKIVKLLFLALVAGGIYFATQNKEEIQKFIDSFSTPSDVLTLNESNFDSVIEQNKQVLIKFYAPWCGHCKRMAPDYEKVATYFLENGDQVKIAKVDVTQNRPLGERFDVKGFPTLKWFVDGQAQEYNGGRTFQEIVAWINKKTGKFSFPVKSSEELTKMALQNKVLAVFFTNSENFEQNSNWSVYKQVGENLNSPLLVHTLNDQVSSEYKQGQLVIFRDFDGGNVVFDQEFTAENVEKFLKGNVIPSMFEFDNAAIEYVFQSQKITLVLFEGNNDASVQARKVLEELAGLKRQGQTPDVLLSFINNNSPDNHFQKLSEFLDAQSVEYPHFTLVDTASGKINKFQFTEEINQQNLLNFVNKFFSGDLKPTLKSEEIPENNNEPVKVLVGKNFRSEVIDNDKDVLVKFYAPWCGHCKKLAPFWDEAASQLRDNQNIVIAKIDSTLNDVEGVEIEGYPTIKFFPGNDKANPIDFRGERSTEGIVNWLRENTTHQWVNQGSEQNNEQQQQQEQKQEDL